MTDLYDAGVALAPLSDRGLVRPLSGHTGAVIDGLDLREPLSAADHMLVAEALDRWKVLFFRDQHPPGRGSGRSS